MDIHISADGVATLEGADDFTSLRLTGTAPVAADQRAALAVSGIELADDDLHADIAPGTIPRLAGATTDAPEWQPRYEAMIDYATRKGWVDDTGRIRVHAEWES